MNEAPNNQTGLNDTFSSQPSPQSNPFTADLKGEFTSNFGTNTNAVSQIFKEGGFVGQNKQKYMIIGGVLLVVLAAVVYFTMFDSSSPDVASTTTDAPAVDEGQGDDAATADDSKSTDDVDKSEDGAKDETASTSEEKTEEAAAAQEAAPKATAHAHKGKNFGSGAVTLASPSNGAGMEYDETKGAVDFTWTGGGGTIVFSRNSSMNQPVLRIPVNGNSYSFQHPWPGNWYWRVENASGKTETRSFRVESPKRRAIALQQPQSGGSIAGNGGTVSWQGDSNVAFYRVELANGSFVNPQHRFASSGNSVQLTGVAPGTYQMRVGAFSEVSGRWEYTTPVSVTVQ